MNKKHRKSRSSQTRASNAHADFSVGGAAGAFQRSIDHSPAVAMQRDYLGSLSSDNVQRKVDLEEEEKKKQASQRVVQKKENRTGLPDNLKSGVENLSGLDMSDVHVHYNSSKPAQLNALAYAQGSQIHVAPGQERHLPHEAWHVAQQKSGRVQANTSVAGEPVNDSPALESEADVMGARANRYVSENTAGPAQSTQRMADGSLETSDPHQLKCVNCEEDEKKSSRPVQKKTFSSASKHPIQKADCNPTNRGGETLHDYVVRHLENTRGWDKEYQCRDGGGGVRYADLVTAGRGNVYEVKSQAQGAAVAQAEAALYAGWISNTCPENPARGGWTGRADFDMGDLGTACVKGHGQGGITYDRSPPGGAACNVLIP